MKLSRLALMVAGLAAVKLILLVGMGLQMPGAPATPALQAPAAITAGASVVPADRTLPTAPVSPQGSVVSQPLDLAARMVLGIAQDSPAQAAAAPDAKQPAAPAQTPAPSKDAKDAKQPSGAPESVLTVAVLKQRAEALDRQEQALRALENDLNTRMASLKELETTLKTMLDEGKALKDEKMRHLIDVYINMKAKQAASVLETLDENVAVKILAGMKGRQAGEILTNVSAKKAAKLSEALTKMQVTPDLPQKP